MRSLIEFYKDEDTRENVHNYLTEFLSQEAVKKVFNKEDVSAVAEAKEVIDKAFENMGIMFQETKVGKEQINEAR